MYRNLNHLATFAALAETGSFAAAARRLRLPSSTVSEHIAALERNLGLQLVIRTTRKCRLTDVGRQVAQGASRMVEAAEETMARVDAAVTRPAGKLRISLPFAFAAELIGPAVGRFAALYPGIRLEMRVSNEVDDLIAGGFDLAVRIGPLADSSLVRRKLGTEPQDLVASAGYLAGNGRPDRPADLAQHSLVGYRPEQTFTLTGPDGPEQVSFTAHVAANDPKTVLSIIRGDAGIGIVPRFLSGPGLKDGSLEVVLPQYRPAAAEMSIVHYGPAASNPRTELFARFLLSEMRRPDRWAVR